MQMVEEEAVSNRMPGWPRCTLDEDKIWAVMGNLRFRRLWAISGQRSVSDKFDPRQLAILGHKGKWEWQLFASGDRQTSDKPTLEITHFNLNL